MDRRRIAAEEDEAERVRHEEESRRLAPVRKARAKRDSDIAAAKARLDAAKENYEGQQASAAESLRWIFGFSVLTGLTYLLMQFAATAMARDGLLLVMVKGIVGIISFLGFWLGAVGTIWLIIAAIVRRLFLLPIARARYTRASSEYDHIDSEAHRAYESVVSSVENVM